MEASSSQPSNTGTDRTINPATGAAARDRDREREREREPKQDASFNTEDLRRWEDSRIKEVRDGLSSLAAGLEQHQEEMRQVFRNELILAAALLIAGGVVAGMAREIIKLREAASVVPSS